jgi:hypothetical protein
LDLARHHADDGESHSRNQHRFSDRGSAAEKLFFQAATEKDHAPALKFILGVDPSAFRGHFVAHLTIFGADPANRRRPHHPVTESNARPADSLETYVLHKRRGRFDDVQIGLLQKHFLPRPLASWLFAGLLRPADDHALAESVEAVYQDTAEAAPIGDKERYRSNAPHDAQHCEQGAGHVALERDPGFENDFN